MNTGMSIRIEKVCKSYFNKKQEITVLKDIDYTFENNKLYLIKGTSGKGKTTLLSILGLLDSPTAGKVFLDDQRVDHLPEKLRCKIRNERYAFVFQDYGLLENLTVYENLKLILEETKEKVPESKIDDVLKDLNMLHRKNHVVAKLSGGEKQRASFARAMIKQSDIFVCDEPISNVDSENATVILNILKQLKKSKIVIVSIHSTYIDEICDEIVTL